MLPANDIIDQWRVLPGKLIHLKDYDSSWSGDRSLPKSERKKYAETVLSQDVSKLAEAQDLLYAANRWSILMILQAMDAAGKDSTIKHVMSGVNPQGCQVYSFKHPSAEELDHTFFWRYAKALPERGRIGIFNRSYFEEVLVVRVHPELVAAQRIPNIKVNDDLWADRFADINAFERHLTRNGTLILKFFLHISKDEQRKRLIKRLEDPKKASSIASLRSDGVTSWLSPRNSPRSSSTLQSDGPKRPAPNIDFFKAITARTSLSKRCCDSGLSLLG